MYFMEFFVFSLILFLLGFWFYYSESELIIKWDMGIWDFSLVGFEMVFDWLGVMFGGVVLFVGSFIILYSYWYVDFYLDRFYYMMNMFILSMLFLIFSPNILGMLLGWDGLGVISFCLIWFYYGSGESITNSLVTMLFNRLGDSFLLCGIGLFFLMSDILGFNMFDYYLFFCFLFILGLGTKSAQFPFSSWLPKAMAAPTPVSSLVHSSTLVTSGLYMMIRYYNCLSEGLYYLEFLGLITLLVGGTSAFMEFDLKKIIAYSTLSQMGLMVYLLGLGFSYYVYFHMLIHAVFKSMMFMCAGVIIHETGYQDIRCCSGMYIIMPYLILMMGGSIMSLIGFPFVSGFFSKDMLIESLFSLEYSFFKFVLGSLGILVTPIYGGRLLYYMIVKGVNGPMYMEVGFGGLISSIIMLFFSSIIAGSFIFGGFIGFMDLYSYIGLVNIFITCYMILGLVMGLIFMFCNLNWYVLYVYSKFWFIDCLSYLFKGGFLMLGGILYYFDKVWFEIGLGLKSYNYLRFAYKHIYSYDFSFMFYYLFMLVLLVLVI